MRHLRFDGVKIKSPKQIEEMRRAGRLSAKALQAAGSLVSSGVTAEEIDAEVERVIRQEGGVPAFKGYGGFPASICASVNDVIVHGIPSSDVVLEDGDIVSIDTGAVLDGWVSDNAATFCVGHVDDEKLALIEATERALQAGIDAARAGNHLGDIGHAVWSVAKDAGFDVVRGLSGHGIGRRMHEKPSVLNFGRPGEGLLLEEGMVIAIEPMLVAGTSKTRTLSDGWSIATADGRPSAHFEKTVAITAGGPSVLTEQR